MIITENKSKQVVRSHDFEEVNCTIDAEDMRYVASLLRNNYSNTRLAVVREISANALDANLEAGATRPIEVKLPTSMNPTFSVRDFGGGLSQDEVFNLYSKYGKSTKRESNNYIGAFGIGKFAPLSYGDSFTCVSYRDGLKVSYSVFVDELDDTKIVKLHDEPSNEPSGLCIEVAVADEDRDEFSEVVQKFFQFFSDDEMPKFLGVEEDFIPKREKILESKDESWFVLEEGRRDYYSRNESHVIMGRVAYPLDRDAIKVENFVDSSDPAKKNILENLLSMEGFYLRVPLGSVKLHHSRESLEYNKATQKKIVESLLVAVKEIQEIAKEKLADSSDLWEAKRNHAKIVNAMPYGLRNIFDNAFEWQGIKITSADFHRDYQLQDDLIITHSWREEDADARNGFKVRSQKANRAICQDNYLFLIQDLESSHGNNLRVRTLLNEDESLQGVYILHPKTKVAEDTLYNSWELDRVDKSHRRYTSNVEKEKPIRSGVRKTNGSKANIPLFSMKSSGHHYRIADHWESVEGDFNMDVSEVEGSVNGKFLYVSIKNFKPDCLSWELGVLYNNFRSIKAEDAFADIKLFGVRAGDVKKLDKETWLNFEDFYIEYAKSALLADREESNKIATSLELSEKFYDDEDLNGIDYTLGNLFSNETFVVDKDHSISKLHKLYTLAKGELHPKLTPLYRLLNRKGHKDWIESEFNTLVSFDRFKEDIQNVMSKYPLLLNIGEATQRWKNLNEDDYLKNIQQYISLCDGSGE